jgi:lysophospholipase L1-like esterase
MLRTRMRWLIVGVALVAILLSAIVAVPSLRALADSDRPQEYLALGDSVAFGFNPLLDKSDASNFIGYPDVAAAALKENLTNASCSGEAAGGFISITGTDNGCRGYRAYFPLHVAYPTPTTTQLEFADQFLQSHPQTLVVSIDIGANDLFVMQQQCLGSVACILQQIGTAAQPGPFLQTLAANLDTIFGHIRNQDDYHHKLVALTYYSLDYSDPLGTGVIGIINSVIADRTLAWGGIVADGYTAFAVASSYGDACAAGLLIVLSASPLICDVHPTPAGRDLLAQAIVSALRAD